jgi:hypothetical protein
MSDDFGNKKIRTVTWGTVSSSFTSVVVYALRIGLNHSPGQRHLLFFPKHHGKNYCP